VIEPLARLLAPDNLNGITTRPLPALRDLRIQCSEVESDISLVRRMAQGRLDIVGHEVRRRAGEGSGEAPRSLLFELPDLLADGPRPEGTQRGRPVAVGLPGPVAAALGERLDLAVSPSVLAGIGQVPEAELREVFDRLRSFELELSSVRRQLHDRIDAIQSEIGRRYRDGEASIESLLS
jgi:hypothetical protein